MVLLLLIQVGKGNIIGIDRVLDWQGDTNMPISSLGFSTGYGADGVWEVSNLRGDYCTKAIMELCQELNECFNLPQRNEKC